MNPDIRNELRFVDAVPPTRRPTTHDYASIAEQLRAHPGQWALCFPDAPAWLVDRIRNGRVAALASDEFEIKTERSDLGSPEIRNVFLMFNPRKGNR